MRPALPSPEAVKVHPPIQGNTGKYMCPYTSDGVLTDWVQKGIKVGLAAKIGGAVGAGAVVGATRAIPIVGIAGYYGGKAITRKIALESMGGEEFIKKTSDLSFDYPDDLAVYMYAKHSTHPDYKKALEATFSIYPKLRTRNDRAIRKAKLT